MKLGAFELYPVSDGRFRLDGGAMFGIVPKVLWEPCCPADERNRIQLALNCLLIRAYDKLILVDTGLGDQWQPKYQDIFAIDRPTALLHSLQELQVYPDEIDLVINTHLHFDHAGGNTSKEEHRGTIVPTFPKAKYVVQRGEFDEATHPNERTKASYRAETFTPIAETGQWEFLDGDTEILPGISVLVTGGHTTYHQIIKIESEGQIALYLGDLVPTVSHLPLPYIMGYDLFPLQTLEAKRRLLTQACENKWLLFFEHDPHIQCGFVDRNNQGTFCLAKGGHG
ncbi:MAG: MBL fold metallo-hydrolase [Nitrospirae bacterium]|nr:MAG: MBL fold metallo-hydrolase [Nitrospirota bacterium]